MKHAVLLLGVVITGILASQPSEAQVPLSLAGWGEEIGYRDKVVALCRTHISNHRVESTRKFWELNKKLYNESKYQFSETTAVHGPKSWLFKSAYGTSSTPTKSYDGRYLDEDSYYVFSNKELAVPFKLDSFAVEWKESQRYTSAFESFQATRQLYLPRPEEKILSHERSTYEGRDALKVVAREKLGITKTIYLDADTYQLLYWEADKAVDFSQRGMICDDKTYTRVAYRDAGRKWLPTKYEWYRVTTAGQKQMIYEDEFPVYEPYTPTADDLDLEKQFGVKPIAHEPRPASAMPKEGLRSRAVWWYAGGGVLIVVAVGLLLLARRRRAADGPPPGSRSPKR